MPTANGTHKERSRMTGTQYKIIQANLDDTDWLLGQLVQFAQFYGTRRSLFGRIEQARASLEDMIKNHIVLIAWRDTLRVGFISGYVTPHPYNTDIRLLAETFWWVDPQHRMSRAGLMLLDKFTDWGNANCDWITFSLEHHSPVKDTCLVKRGYKLQEYSYLKEV